MFSVGDIATFYSTGADLPFYKRFIGYEYLYVSIHAQSDQQEHRLGFVAEYKDYLNRPTVGQVMPIHIEFHNRALPIYYHDRDEIIEYRLTGEEAKELNYWVKKIGDEVVSQDEDWLVDIFPKLDRDMNGDFYSQLLGLHV